MADSSAIDNALMALLAGDTTLMGIATDGVFWDEAPPQATRFVIVSFVDEVDWMEESGRGMEDGLYLVKAVILKQREPATSPPMTASQEAADRIDTVLEGATLLASGYTPMTVARESRIRYTDVDDANNTIRWFHRGGHYRVLMSLD